MLCTNCLESTRVFGVCVRCAPRPTPSPIAHPTIRWFIEVLAEEPEYTLSDEAVRLIRKACESYGFSIDEHEAFKAAWEAGAAKTYAESPEALATGRYVGTPGGRWEGRVRCDKIVPLGPSEWGDRFLLIFTTVEAAEGTEAATIVWFTGEGGKFDPREGQEYTIRGTVHKDKGHKVYKGVRQTVVQRVKNLEANDAE